MCEQYRRGVPVERTLDDLARVDRGLGQCQYCLVRKNSWFGVAWLIDSVPSFPRAIVAGSLFDSSNISFASTRHSAVGSHLT